MQRDSFLKSAGDEYYERNRGKFDGISRVVLDALKPLPIRPKRILEIGCSAGHRLEQLQREYGAQCYGIDPSRRAIDAGSARASYLRLSVGTADRLDFGDEAFDLVIFGHCLYLCDPEHHFRIASEADRVLQDGGFLVVADFISNAPHRNAYSHNPGTFSYKMDFSKMFLWHPSYRLIARSYFENNLPFTLDHGESAAVDILHKDRRTAFAENSRGD